MYLWKRRVGLWWIFIEGGKKGGGGGGGPNPCRKEGFV